MKTNLALKSVIALGWFATLLAPLAGALAQGTAFTYQGRLNDSLNPAGGSFDVTFSLWTGSIGPGQVGGTVTNSAVIVSNGLFTALVDFGPNIFTGPDLWLELGVRTNGGAFSTLSPRQRITATPYAVHAGRAATLAGTVASNQLAGTYSGAVTFVNSSNLFAGRFSGDGSLLTNLNAAALTGVIPAAALNNAWKLTGNTGTTAGVNFVGTTDNQPLEIKVNGLRAFRFEPNSELAPNVIGGASVNFAASNAVGATISGGGTLNYLGLGFTESNAVFADFGTIGGGWSNVVRTTAVSGTVGGGYGNVVDGPDATVGGGNGNVAGGSRATIAGGLNNSAGGDWSAIGGGGGNVSGNTYAVIAGGSGNDVFGQYSAIGGGLGNLVDVGADRAAIAGGQGNVIGLDYASIGGGLQNTNLGNYSAVGGGRQNRLEVSSDYSVIPGGRSNSVNADYAFAAGRRAHAGHSGAFVWADSTDADFASISNNEVAFRATGGARVVGTSTLGSLTVAPNEPADGDDSQLVLAEDHDATYGVVVKYDGGVNQLQVLRRYLGTNSAGAYLVVVRDTGNIGVKRTPADNDFEVEGAASKTTAGSWLANSDARIKTDIQPVNGALAALDRVRLVSFRYTDEYRRAHPSLKDQPYLNVIAQEFRDVFPDYVKSSGEKLPDGSDLLQVDTHPLTIYSAAAIQELNRKLERLTAELGRQRAETDALRLRLEKLEQRQP